MKNTSPFKIGTLCVVTSLLSVLLFIQCDSNPKPKKEKPAPKSFTEQVATAHRKFDFTNLQAVSFDLALNFGGREVFDGQITLATDGSKGKIIKKDETEIWFMGEEVLVSPEMTNKSSARFAAYTWSYFFLFPYKMDDPGTKWQEYKNCELNNTSYQCQKLSFMPGTGDAPDDWYIAYANSETQLLHAVAYIVTGPNTTAEEAEEDPHAIKYENYVTHSGIPIATEWSFWGWQPDSGLTDQLGSATLKNIQFLEADQELFEPAKNLVEVK